jgi:protein SCO1/2
MNLRSLALLCCAALPFGAPLPARAAAPDMNADVEAPDVGINPRYLLQAANGRAIMDGDFRHQFQLITFGYTFCPDVCPTTLLEMAEILKQLGPRAAQVQPLFFSVDPERDTLEQLRNYVDFFDKRIIPATGKPELVRRAAENFKVRYEKVAAPGADPANYAVDHSAGMFLLAPGGQFIAKFPYGTPVADIVARLRQEIALRQPAPEAAQ